MDKCAMWPRASRGSRRNAIVANANTSAAARRICSHCQRKTQAAPPIHAFVIADAAVAAVYPAAVRWLMPHAAQAIRALLTHKADRRDGRGKLGRTPDEQFCLDIWTDPRGPLKAQKVRWAQGRAARTQAAMLRFRCEGPSNAPEWRCPPSSPAENSRYAMISDQDSLDFR